MKHYIRLLALCLAPFCASCAAPTKQQEQKIVVENYIAYPAAALAQRLKEAGQVSQQEGSLLKIGPRQIQIEPRIENQIEKDGRWLIGVEMQVLIDGKDAPAFHAGAVGVDVSREAALETAAEEWSQQYGLALVHGLFPSPLDKKPVVSGAYHIFPGPVGLRGASPIQSFEAILKELSDVAGHFVRQTFPHDKAERHGLSISIASVAGKGKEVMCFVDGKKSAELSKAVSHVVWPADGSYLFKRFYLFEPIE